MSRINRILKLTGELVIVVDPKELFYLTGCHFSRGMLLVHKGGIELFVDPRYIERAKSTCSIAASLTTKENVEKFLNSIDFTTISINPQTITYQEFERLKSSYFSKKQIDTDPVVQKSRMVKDAKEIVALQESAHLNYKGYLHAKKLLQQGISEAEVAWEFEKYCRDRGAQSTAFDPIVAFGSNTSMPHYTPSKDTLLKKGDPIIFDFGVVLNDYCSDLTRSFLFEGENVEYEDLAKMVKKAHHDVLRMCKPKVPMNELDRFVREGFRKSGTVAEFSHNLGHSIGLEVHEQPVLTSSLGDEYLLEEGCVFAIEPGLYQAGKWGYRHEDVICITKDGCTNFYPEGDEV